MNHKNHNLKAAVALSELTNYQIELKADIPLTKLSRIIHGAVRPSEEEITKISQVLGKTPTELFPDFHSTMAV